MAPNQPLPLSERFPDPDTYIDSLLDFITTSELFQRLCGGVHILDFITREPDLYSTILPLSWRQWFYARELQDILDLLMREDLEQFCPRSADNTQVNGSPGASLGDAATMLPSWRDGPFPPESLLDYIRNIRGHCLSRSFPSVDGMNGAPPRAKQTTLARHVTVGMKPKKIHEVENFARYVDDLASDLARRNHTEITHLVDFGSGQNYLGRALASKPYERNVIAIESRRLNIDGAREMDVTAKLAKKQQIIRNKKEHRSQLTEKTAKLDTVHNESSRVAVNCPPWKSMPSGAKDVLGTTRPKDIINAEESKIQYVEQEIRSGDLASVIEKATAGQATSPETPTPKDDSEERPALNQVPRAANTSLMVISLHSCGNLLHHGIRSLILNPSVAAVALVGCCYNLVTERLGPPSLKLPTLRPPNSRLEQTSSACDPHGFPMSERLATYEHSHGKGIRLNITARMMAVQAPYNWTPSECKAFFKRHFFRALLQRVFVDLEVVTKPTVADDTGGRSPRGWSGRDEPIILGSLPKACHSSFTAYVRGAVAKLADDSERGLSIRQKFNVLTDAVLEDYERRYHGKKKELSIIWSLMAFSATVVESIIVVDRWLFLREQELVQDCWVEAVFDYKQSPRNLPRVTLRTHSKLFGPRSSATHFRDLNSSAFVSKLLYGHYVSFQITDQYTGFVITMDSSTNFPAAYRIGGLEYEYSDDPAHSVANGWGETERHDSPIFSLSVGPSKTAYFAHQEVLCESPVLEGCCTSGLRESQTRHIELPEDDPIVIGHLIDYLYLDCISEYVLEGDESANLLASIYIAADKYGVDDLKEEIVGYLKECECLPLMSEEGFLKVSRYIYENTPESDKVYKAFFMDVACAWFQDETKDLNSHIEPYVREGGLLAYDIYQAQLRVSAQRKNMYDTSEKLRKRSEVLHKREHHEDQAQIAVLTAQKRLFRKYFYEYRDDHHSSHPECYSCGSRDRL